MGIRLCSSFAQYLPLVCHLRGVRTLTVPCEAFCGLYHFLPFLSAQRFILLLTLCYTDLLTIHECTTLALLKAFLLAIPFVWSESLHPPNIHSASSSFFFSDLCSKFAFIRETFLDHLLPCYSLCLLPAFFSLDLLFIYLIFACLPH